MSGTPFDFSTVSGWCGPTRPRSTSETVAASQTATIKRTSLSLSSDYINTSRRGRGDLHYSGTRGMRATRGTTTGGRGNVYVVGGRTNVGVGRGRGRGRPSTRGRPSSIITTRIWNESNGGNKKFEITIIFLNNENTEEAKKNAKLQLLNALQKFTCLKFPFDINHYLETNAPNTREPSYSSLPSTSSLSVSTNPSSREPNTVTGTSQCLVHHCLSAEDTEDDSSPRRGFFIHGFAQFEQFCFLHELNQFIRFLFKDIAGINIQVCRHTDTYLKNITKDDKYPLYNCNSNKLHFNFRLEKYCKDTVLEPFSPLPSFVVEYRHCCRFIRRYKEQWNRDYVKTHAPPQNVLEPLNFSSASTDVIVISDSDSD